MDNKIKTIYKVLLIISLSFLFFIAFRIKSNVFEKRRVDDVIKIENYEKTSVKNAELPCGVKEVYKMKLPDEIKGEKTIMFYFVHQNVEVYLDEELVFSCSASKENVFGRTPGCQWGCVELYEEDAAKELTIIYIPVYKSCIGKELNLYYGAKSDIRSLIFEQEGQAYILSLISIILGCLFIMFSIYIKFSINIKHNLWLMGCFSCCVGLWKLTDCSISAMLFPYQIWVTYIPYFSLMLLVIPFAMYLKDMFFESKYIWWYIPVVGSIIEIVISFLLQILNICDLRESLTFSHIAMVMVIVVSIIRLIVEIRKYGVTQQLKVVLICMITCFGGTLMDIVIYYFFPTRVRLQSGMYGFLIYILVLGTMSVIEARKLMEKGMEAKRLEEIAYHDALTGLLNRSCFEKEVEQESFQKEECYVFVFDLNNLKYCNDNFGHDVGDLYIKTGASLIQKTFGDIGSCYRMGGDEFWVLVQKYDRQICEQKIKEFEELMENENKKDVLNYPVKIALGFAEYNPEVDYNIQDTFRRADKQMYVNKMNMKGL